MIEKYYNGVIEQVYNKLGKSDNNIVMMLGSKAPL